MQFSRFALRVHHTPLVSNFVSVILECAPCQVWNALFLEHKIWKVRFLLMYIQVEASLDLQHDSSVLTRSFWKPTLQMCA